jgi:hypothetical protein
MPDSAVVDDDSLVSLAEQTGLSTLLADKVHIVVSRIKSAAPTRH